MAYLRTLVVGLLAGFTLTAHAGYAQLAAPPGFSVSGGGFGYAAAANDQVFGRVIHQSGALTANVGGQAVKMPAAYRLAANAPRIAARAIFLHPGIRTAAGIAIWLGLANIVWDQATKAWKVQRGDGSTVVSDGYEYRAMSPGAVWRPTAREACRDWLNVLSQTWAGSYEYTSSVPLSDGYCALAWNSVNGGGAGTEYQGYEIRQSQCPAGWYITQGGVCTQTPQQQPLTQEQFEDALQPHPMPETVPLELPKPTTLPVEQPFINPEPGPNPAHRPQFVPTGNPVPNPKYDPNSPVGPANQPYLQPGVRIVPSPTPSNPWQVDMQPVDRPVVSPDPKPDAVPDPESGDGDKPKPEDQQSLCEKHPDIVACQKLGDLSPQELPKNTVSLTINREDGFGPSDGACPAPREFVILGKQMAFRWDLICDFASGIRPLLVGFAYLSAALAFLGLSRREV